MLLSINTGRKFVLKILLFLAYASSLYCQRDTSFSSNGNIEFTTEMHDGLCVGVWKRFYLDGNILSMTSYSNNSKRSKLIEYWPNGNVRKEYEFRWDREKKDYARVGKSRMFYRTGELYVTNIYRRGYPNGISKEYHLNGKLSGVGKKSDGKKEDFWRSYDENGKRIPETKDLGKESE